MPTQKEIVIQKFNKNSIPGVPPPMEESSVLEIISNQGWICLVQAISYYQRNYDFYCGMPEIGINIIYQINSRISNIITYFKQLLIIQRINA